MLDGTPYVKLHDKRGYKFFCFSNLFPPKGTKVYYRRKLNIEYGKTMEKKDEIIKKIAKILSEFKDVELSYIFGSFYEGREFRDIDVAVLLSRSRSAYESARLAMRIGGALEKALKYKFEFDVKVLNSSPIYFQHEVIKNGKLIFCRSEAKRVRYESRVLSKYLDYREVLDWFDEKLLARA